MLGYLKRTKKVKNVTQAAPAAVSGSASCGSHEGPFQSCFRVSQINNTVISLFHSFLDCTEASDVSHGFPGLVTPLNFAALFFPFNDAPNS